MLDTESASRRENKTADPRIISIIGMGGLGKTTLARLVFNDENVRSHFPVTMWVSVSHPFDLTMIAKAIIQEATRNITQTSEWNSLHKELCDSVKSKRFFLVLDDIWTQDPKNWDPLRHLLTIGAQGSFILVTTRNEGVASMMNSSKYFLSVLSPEDCCSLLRLKAFSGMEKEENIIFQDISFQIANKCKGLPLAASLLGSLLNKKKTQDHWHRVLRSKIWELKGFDHGQELLNPALLLSYNELPSPLKNCFAYCAIFPKDHSIYKQTLIRMWMAQGFLNTENITNELELESIGEDYFDDLVSLSFSQDVSVEDDGSKVQCKMHDLVHELTQFLTSSECFIKHSKDLLSFTTTTSKATHLTLAYAEKDVEPSSFYASIYKIENLRTLQVSSDKWAFSFGIGNLSSDLFHHLRCLRVLKLKNMGITHIPDEIEKLIHLRYLNLSQNESLNELPDKLCSLCNLQTLKLKMCKGLRRLPKGMMMMVNLRHLDITMTGLECLPEGIRRLKSLRTLSTFIVSNASGQCDIRELKDLNSLQDHIEIYGLGRLKTANEASQAGLQKLHQLHGLCLDFSEAMASTRGKDEQNIEMFVAERAECVLGVLQPHENLVNLAINQYLGFKFPSWMASSTVLTHLCRLKLYKCSNCSELPALGLLPSLEKLVIESLDKLKRIGVEIYGSAQVAFPKLLTLEIDADNLELWEIGYAEVVGEIMPCVTTIRLSCKMLKVIPTLGKLPSLETLEICAADQVTRIGGEFYGIGDGVAGDDRQSVDIVAFPKLKFLRVQMKKLEVWELGEGEVATGKVMPCVTVVHLLECEKLIILPALGKLPSLETLTIKYAYRVTSISREFYGANISNGGENDNSLRFPKLSFLEISDMVNLEVMDLGVVVGEPQQEVSVMPCLSELRIRYCAKLKTLRALTKLQSLRTLELSYLENLEELKSVAEVPEEENPVLVMPRLLHLALFDCNNLKSIPRHLPSLRELSIMFCPSVIDPQYFPLYPRLTFLEISNSHQMSFPLQEISELRELQYLNIHSAEPRMCIPECARSLTKLEELSISNRYRRYEGGDWSLISHIPNITINGKKI